jgi:hypothetical protein
MMRSYPTNTPYMSKMTAKLEMVIKDQQAQAEEQL